MNKEISVIFSSFGDYQDLLSITYHFFSKNWGDCPFDVYWGSNGKKIKNFNLIAPKWNYIYKSKKDLGWSYNLKSYLEEIKTDYVLLMLDDFLILKKPNINMIQDGFELMKKKKAIYFRLNDKPPADKKITDIFGIINYYSDYRSSLQPSIWKKNILLKLCEYNFNPWLFEWKAGIVKETIKKTFLGVYQDLIFSQHCIEKGMWIEEIYDLIKKEQIDVNKIRQIYKPQKIINNNIYFKDKVISKVPKQIMFHLRKFLKKGIFSEKFIGYSHNYFKNEIL